MSSGPKEIRNSSFMSHKAGWESLKKTHGDKKQILQRADTSALVNRNHLLYGVLVLSWLSLTEVQMGKRCSVCVSAIWSRTHLRGRISFGLAASNCHWRLRLTSAYPKSWKKLWDHLRSPDCCMWIYNAAEVPEFFSPQQDILVNLALSCLSLTCSKGKKYKSF